MLIITIVNVLCFMFVSLFAELVVFAEVVVFSTRKQHHHQPLSAGVIAAKKINLPCQAKGEEWKGQPKSWSGHLSRNARRNYKTLPIRKI